MGINLERGIDELSSNSGTVYCEILKSKYQRGKFIRPTGMKIFIEKGYGGKVLEAEMPDQD